MCLPPPPVVIRNTKREGTDFNTGKGKGYWFVEYPDQATMRSALRNLNNVEFKGRNLRVDVTDRGNQKIRQHPQHPQHPGVSGAANLQPPMAAQMPTKPQNKCNQIVEQVNRVPLHELWDVMAEFKKLPVANARLLFKTKPQVAHAMLQVRLLHCSPPPHCLRTNAGVL